jgi:hypothetical protein
MTYTDFERYEEYTITEKIGDCDFIISRDNKTYIFQLSYDKKFILIGSNIHWIEMTNGTDRFVLRIWGYRKLEDLIRMVHIDGDKIIMFNHFACSPCKEEIDGKLVAVTDYKGNAYPTFGHFIKG